MPALDAAHRGLGPTPREDAIPSLAQWAEEHKAALRRVVIELDSLRPRPVEAVEVAALDASLHHGHRAASELTPIVDTMLSAAMARLEAEVEAARAEADAAVAVVMRRVAEGRVRVRPVVVADRPTPDFDGRDGAEASEHVFGPEREDLREPAQVYEMFWADATHDRAVLGRLRRWVQREAW